MQTTVVKYEVDEETEVYFEIQPPDDFHPAGADELIGNLKKAVEPAVEGAKAVLEKVKEMQPDEVEVKFGVKASGTMNWLIARAVTEGNFEITLSWKSSTAAP